MNISGKIYQEHIVFAELDKYFDFYENISTTVMGFAQPGIKSQFNTDTYMFSSMRGTIDSMKILLQKGRINDSYALLRKYYDSVIINIYAILYLADNVSLDNFFVEQMDKWITGKEPLPEYRIMSSYVKKSEKLRAINDILYKDNTYKSLRNRCNGHTHYNSYHYLLLNDEEIHLPYRLKALDQFTIDLRNIFILHFSCLIILNPHYAASTDYIDYLDCGLTPPEGSEYWVAPFIQQIFDNTIKVHKADIARLILQNKTIDLK